MRRTSDEMKWKLSVQFQGEEGIDAGGVTREWYQVRLRYSDSRQGEVEDQRFNSMNGILEERLNAVMERGFLRWGPPTKVLSGERLLPILKLMLSASPCVHVHQIVISIWCAHAHDALLCRCPHAACGLPASHPCPHDWRAVQVMAREMFNPNFSLFVPMPEGGATFQPNPNSTVQNDPTRGTDHLDFFRFVGRVVGKALHDGMLVDAYFTRSFYKHCLGQPLTYQARPGPVSAGSQ